MQPLGQPEHEMPWVIPDVMAVTNSPTPQALPLAGLLPLSARTHLAYAIARTDRSGRLHDRLIVDVAGWRSGDTLSVAVAESHIVFRPDPRGLVRVTKSRAVAIPSAARHRLMIHNGDRVLLAAHSGLGLIIAYPLATLDEALADFHTRAAVR